MGTDEGRAIGFLPGGDLALVGASQSFDLPMVNASRNFPVSDDAFVARITDELDQGNGGNADETLVTQRYSDRESANLPTRSYRIREQRP